jgi:hypothetical protein
MYATTIHQRINFLSATVTDVPHLRLVSVRKFKDHGVWANDLRSMIKPTACRPPAGKWKGKQHSIYPKNHYDLYDWQKLR